MRISMIEIQEWISFIYSEKNGRWGVPPLDLMGSLVAMGKQMRRKMWDGVGLREMENLVALGGCLGTR
jgi:hypothetical protein